MTSLRQRMLEDLQIRNYAPTTVECYIRSVAEFAKHSPETHSGSARSIDISCDLIRGGNEAEST